ncbi:hypothetical protein NBRC10512v2_007726 [Rhodotorula toruloides]
MVLSPALLSPLHRFPVLWCSYRPLLRAARTAPLDEHHRLAIEQYIKREFRQWRSLRTVNKVKPKLREAEERRYDKQALAKEFVEMASEEERIERAAGVRESRYQAMPTTRVADEWRSWIRTAQKQEQREYKRRDMRISPELYATVRGLRRSIAQKKSAAGQARRQEAQLAAE